MNTLTPAKFFIYGAAIFGMAMGLGWVIMTIDSGTDVQQQEEPVSCIADCKSGCGCLRPRLQEDGSWRMEFSNTDWRKE